MIFFGEQLLTRLVFSNCRYS